MLGLIYNEIIRPPGYWWGSWVEGVIERCVLRVMGEGVGVNEVGFNVMGGGVLWWDKRINCCI